MKFDSAACNNLWKKGGNFLMVSEPGLADDRVCVYVYARMLAVCVFTHDSCMGK